MNIASRIVIFLLIAHAGFTQPAFRHADLSVDYSTLALERTEYFQLSERLLRVQLATNLSDRINCFLLFSKHDVIVNKKNYATNYPVGIGFSYNFPIRNSFCFSVSSSLNYTRYVLLKENPHIQKTGHVMNLAGGPSFRYRLPMLQCSMFIYTGIVFNAPLKAAAYTTDSPMQLLNSYPFVGLGYRLRSRATN